LIAGLAPSDDAAAYRLSDDLAVIATLDFFRRSSTTPARSARSRPRTR
jgi:selenophosphate synthase